jgi:hypothetical protein
MRSPWQAVRPKARKNITFRMFPQDEERLRELSERTQLPKSSAFRMALGYVLDEVKRRPGVVREHREKAWEEEQARRHEYMGLI